MDCPICLTPLDEIYTAEGVVVDFCPTCRGTWYDRGELLFFSKHPRQLKPLLEEPLLSAYPSRIRCPRCYIPLEKGGLGSPDLLVDRCANCRGLWLDAGERVRLDQVASTKMAASVDRGAGFSTKSTTRGEFSAPPPVTPPLPRLPNLAFRSTAVLLSLYGIVFLVLLLAVEAFGASPGLAVPLAIAIIVFQYLVSPFIMDLFLRYLQSTRWVSPGELPPHLAAFIDKICRVKDIPFPRVGIIHDGNPNAFTYGRYPGDARLIFTSGLIEMLDEDELQAVAAHEMGHVLHWDTLVMTMASLAPILLYYLYRVLITTRASSRGNPLPLIAVGCFVLYVVSEYLVLFLSRAREYYADQFAGRLTQDPNALSRALVKIAYGLAAARPEEAKEKERSPLRAVRALGIFDPQAALHLATGSGGTTFSREHVVGAMQWDLWNPWARFYELASTHPLPAKRIQALGDLSWHYQKKPFVSFSVKKPESYWDEFFVDLLMIAFPLLLPFAGLALVGPKVFQDLSVIGRAYGLVIAAVGIGSLIRTVFAYPGEPFVDASVATLLKKVKVSAIRSVPVTLKGKIIGRGIPGLVYSADLVLQDETGFIFLDYRQPLRIIEFLFGIFRTPGIIGREVVIEGWYRRAPTPYVEMNSLSYNKTVHRCYVYLAKLGLSILVFALGIGLMLIGSV
ncbi:MAG: M48 family metalloprotease [Candidatus Methylomirabilales bacterium]